MPLITERPPPQLKATVSLSRPRQADIDEERSGLGVRSMTVNLCTIPPAMAPIRYTVSRSATLDLTPSEIREAAHRPALPSASRSTCSSAGS
jgi:hypothetical protein